jgi:hypothetical protein
MTPTLHLPANSRSNRQQTGQRSKMALHLRENLNRSGSADRRAKLLICLAVKGSLLDAYANSFFYPGKGERRAQELAEKEAEYQKNRPVTID